MFETVELLPLSFWVGVVLTLGGAAFASTRIHSGIGLPILAVLGTVTIWYVGDVFYNDYGDNHVQKFSPDVLDNAWWQVAWFLVAFLVLSPLLHRLINGQNKRHFGQMFQLVRFGIGDPQFQSRLMQLFNIALGSLCVLTLIAFTQLGGQILYYFFPFLGFRADPWGRGQIGGGFSAFFSVLSNLQLLLAALFGLVAAMVQNKRVRLLALICCFLTWPYYIFDRTRNSMLVIVLPGLLSWVFFRLRGGTLNKVVALAVCFLIANAWMAFVISNRTTDTISSAIHGEGAGVTQSGERVRHEGLNMFEELCWVNTLIEQDTFVVNSGANYLANLANPIPRGLWPDKPLIGQDYAVARGQRLTATGVTATISMGLIGQGVVNFGAVIGPAFAGLLMALWTVFLARMDLRGNDAGKFGIFQLGMIETFNLGRDFTFIALYPVLFGLLVVWLMSKRLGMSKRPRMNKFQSRKIHSGT